MSAKRDLDLDLDPDLFRSPSTEMLPPISGVSPNPAKRDPPNPSSEMAEEQEQTEAEEKERKEASASSSSEMAEGQEQKEASKSSSSEMAEEKESKYLCYFPDDPNFKYNPFRGGPLDPPPKMRPLISLNVRTLPDPKNPVPKPSVTHFTCKICGDAHNTVFCSYWIKIPENAHIVLDTTSPYQIVCDCSWPIVDGDCVAGCLRNRSRRIAQKYWMYPPGSTPK